MSGLAPTTPPPAGSFSFVLTREPTKCNPTIRQIAATYDETVESYNVTHADGIARATVFVRGEHACKALRVRGWHDRTAEWLAANTANSTAVEIKTPKQRRRRSRRA